jgi:signal transduction histidine kinase
VTREVRTLVDGLRPSPLEQLGLADAIHEHANLWHHNGEPMVVEVIADPLPDLPAATELAAYRIATEAVTNAGRHACATTCHVRLAVTRGRLIVEVTDDGIGITFDVAPGVGLVSMRERAEELGGNLSITSSPGQGTSVNADLPLELE